MNKGYMPKSKNQEHITPDKIWTLIENEWQLSHFYDPCPAGTPYKAPCFFNGLHGNWQEWNYVNPPFGSIIHQGKKKGATAWVRKAIAENEKGKDVVLVYPIDKWILMMVKAGAEIRNLGDVKWLATEDKSPGKGTGRHIACFILKGKKK